MIDLEFVPRFFKDEGGALSKGICDEILFEVYPLLRLLTKFNEEKRRKNTSFSLVLAKRI